jgi:hypothetical protein
MLTAFKRGVLSGWATNQQGTIPGEIDAEKSSNSRKLFLAGRITLCLLYCMIAKTNIYL